MSDPVFIKRTAKYQLNSVGTGRVTYACASITDYDLYNVGDKCTIPDTSGNVVFTGYVKTKTRTSGVMVELYLEDAGTFLRDFNIEDTAPASGEPVLATVRDIISDYLLPASWGLDTTNIPIEGDSHNKLNFPVRYAIRSGSALKHINSLCDMMSLRWTADFTEPCLAYPDGKFFLHLYSLERPAVPTEVTGAATGFNDLIEYQNCLSFDGGDSSKHYLTQLQCIGSEQEIGQQSTFAQLDTSTWGYLESSDTYLQSIDLLAGASELLYADSGYVEGWDTSVSTTFKFADDDAWYTYTGNPGESGILMGIVNYPKPVWTYTSPASAEADATEGLAEPHALYDEMYLVGGLIADRNLDFPFVSPTVSEGTPWSEAATLFDTPTNLMWVGSEIVKFESATIEAGKTIFREITRGVNGVRYIHRKGTKIRPYYPASVASIVCHNSSLYRSGAIFTSISCSGFVEIDGIDKLTNGVLSAASFTYRASTKKAVATLDKEITFPGMWIQTSPASLFVSATSATERCHASDTPTLSLIRSVEYTMGGLVSLEFGTNIPESIHTSKEGVTAFDLVMQKPRQSKEGTIIEYSDNLVCANMKFKKEYPSRSKNITTVSTTDDENKYYSRWVRIK